MSYEDSGHIMALRRYKLPGDAPNSKDNPFNHFPVKGWYGRERWAVHRGGWAPQDYRLTIDGRIPTRGLFAKSDNGTFGSQLFLCLGLCFLKSSCTPRGSTS